MVYTPESSLSGYVDLELPVNDAGTALRFHVDANYADATYSFQNEAVPTESSFLVNARLALADIPMNDGDQDVTFSLWARNVFNEAHIYRRSDANNNTLGSYANFNAPRTFGADVTINF